LEERPEPSPPEEDEQRDAYGDRREDEGKHDDRLDERPSPRRPPGEPPGECEPGRHHEGERRERDLERDEERSQLELTHGRRRTRLQEPRELAADPLADEERGEQP